MAYFVTIGRSYGSGGRYIAKKLSEELGIPFYDNDILVKVSENFGYNVEYVKEHAEKRDGPLSFIGLSGTLSTLTSNQKLALAQFETIERIAKQGESCIFVGRCADFVLRDYPNKISIYISAPMEERIKRATTYYGLSPNKAEATLRKMDKKRASYYNYYTNYEWGMASNYDICINSTIGIDKSVELIKKIIEIRGLVKD